MIGINKEKVRKYFSTEKKCAVLLSPWSTIPDQDILDQAKLEKENRKEEFNEMIEIVDHTRRPKFIRKAVEKFLKQQKIEIGKFAVMHWRYDPVG